MRENILRRCKGWDKEKHSSDSGDIEKRRSVILSSRKEMKEIKNGKAKISDGICGDCLESFNIDL